MKEKNQNKKRQTTGSKILRIIQWPLKVLVLSFCLSFLFSTVSQSVMSKATLTVCIICAVFFIGISVMFDMIALATASCSKDPFLAMGSRKVKGAKQALILLNNSDKISTICADIVGDICGILSGTICAKIVLVISMMKPELVESVIFASLVSSILAGFTVSIKSLSKYYSINYCNQIMMFIGKVLYFLGIGKKKKRKSKIKLKTKKEGAK